MDREKKTELRVAAVIALGSYLPAVAAFASLETTQKAPSPWLVAAGVSLVIAYFLLIDVLLPLGRSHVGVGLDAMRWLRRLMLRNDGWYLRVTVILSIVVGSQMLVDLAVTH